MNLSLTLELHTDGDFHIKDYATLIDPQCRMYKNATVKYEGLQDGEIIWIFLTAEGERNACQWAARDLLEHLVCNIRTHKYYLIKDLYDLVIPAKENLLWSNKNVYHNGSLSGNYDGTFFNLIIQEEGKPMNNDIIKAVKDYLIFEQETSQNYPFAVKNPTDAQIKAIAALCTNDDTEEIHEACEKVLGCAEFLD